MTKEEFLAAHATFASTQQAQTAAQIAHAGQDVHLRQAAFSAEEHLEARKAHDASRAQLLRTEEILTRATEALNVAAEKSEAAQTTKAALKAAEAAHAAAHAQRESLLSQRPAAVVADLVVAHTDPALIARELENGAELVIPKAWPEHFVKRCSLCFVDGAVVVDPAWVKAERIKVLEAELAEQKKILDAAKRAAVLEAELAALKGA